MSQLHFIKIPLLFLNFDEEKDDILFEVYQLSIKIVVEYY